MQLDMLRDYKDDDMKRDFYTSQLKYSILRSLEQLNLIQTELKLLEH